MIGVDQMEAEVVMMRIDQRLFEPGWGGELAPDELDILQVELAEDKRLAYGGDFGRPRNADPSGQSARLRHSATRRTGRRTRVWPGAQCHEIRDAKARTTHKLRRTGQSW